MDAVIENVPKVDYEAVTELALLTGELLLAYGADTKRVEETMEYILGTMKTGTFTVSVLSASIFAAVTPDDGTMPITMMHKISTWSADLTAVHIANDVSRKFCSGAIDVYEALDILRDAKAKAKKSNGIWKCILGYTLATAFTALFLSYDQLMNVLAAFICGIIMGLISYAFRRVQIRDFFVNMIMSFVAVFIAAGMIVIFRETTEMSIIMGAAICPMFPGVNIVNAVRDILHGDYVSGSGRLLEAFVKALGMAIGTVAGTIIIVVAIVVAGV